MDFEMVVDALGDWFLDQPLDVTLEADMQCWLVEQLRNDLEASEELLASCPRPPLTDAGNYAQYKRPYIDAIIEQTTVSPSRMSRVHSEVNLSGPDGPNEQIDVVVFDRELTAPVQWNGGSKRYDERDVMAAFELKFVKNQNVISNDFDAETLRQATEAEMRSDRRIGQLDTQNRKLESDLARLNELPTEDTYLVILSHYNYLFQPELLDRPSATFQKNRKMGWTVDEWLSRETNRGSTNILYVHPGGKNWWR